MLPDPFTSIKNTVIDIGDETFTKGRAHVAIDPTARVTRFIKEARDEETAVIYLDFLLGYALHADPASVMAEDGHKGTPLYLKGEVFYDRLLSLGVGECQVFDFYDGVFHRALL